jgi:hypothetical protein
MPRNQQRAGRIELTLMEYRDSDDDAALTDLLADTLHYCAIYGKDFRLALRRAKRHFYFEQQSAEGDSHE